MSIVHNIVKSAEALKLVKLRIKSLDKKPMRTLSSVVKTEKPKKIKTVIKPVKTETVKYKPALGGK